MNMRGKASPYKLKCQVEFQCLTNEDKWMSPVANNKPNNDALLFLQLLPFFTCFIFYNSGGKKSTANLLCWSELSISKMVIYCEFCRNFSTQ